jgi:dynein assembly factor 3
LAFTFWKNKSEHIYDIKKYWEDQNRVQLKERYDHRNGAFDWDLQMRLYDNGAKQICPQEYKFWRECGVAFTFPEYDSSMPNKTFAMDLRKNGKQFYHRGYIGDMNVGPFISFGIECMDEKMLKSNFGNNSCRSTDITERNIYEVMWEIQNQEKYDPSKDNKNFRAYGSVKLQIGDTPSSSRSFEDTGINLEKYDRPLKSFDNVKVHFLSIDEILGIQNKAPYREFFDLVFVAHNYFAFLKDDFSAILKNPSLIIFETKKYSVMTRDEIVASIDKIKTYCKTLNLISVTSPSLNMLSSIVKFKKV